MAQLSFVIVPSRPNADGSHQIRLKISSNRTIRYISTKFRVGSEKQFLNERVVKHPQAIAINQALSQARQELPFEPLTHPRFPQLLSQVP